MTSRRLVQPDFAPAHLARVYRGRAAGSDQFSLPPSWRRAMSGFYSLPVSFGFLRSCSANPRARKPRHVSAITFSCSFLQKQEGSRQFSYKSRVCLLKDLSQRLLRQTTFLPVRLPCTVRLRSLQLLFSPRLFATG